MARSPAASGTGHGAHHACERRGRPDVRPAGPAPARERLPPGIERRHLEVGRHGCGLDAPKPGRRKKLGKMAFSCAGEVRLVFDPWIKLAGRGPEEPKRPGTTRVVPHRRRRRRRAL